MKKEPKKLKQLSVDGPEEEALAKELLMRALARVSPKYRECLILYHVKGVPKQKIAERLQIKESSVTTYISNGLEEFRQAYAHLSAEHNTPGKER